MFGGFLKSFQIPNGAIEGAEIEDGTVTSADIDVSTLPSLDGHDAFTKKCDPQSNDYVVCAAVSFSNERPMPVLMTVVYSIDAAPLVERWIVGECKTRLDGVEQGSVRTGELYPGYPNAGVPIVDVIPVAAGTHTLEFLCQETGPNDTVFGDIRLAVVELGMD